MSTIRTFEEVILLPFERGKKRLNADERGGDYISGAPLRTTGRSRMGVHKIVLAALPLLAVVQTVSLEDVRC